MLIHSHKVVAWTEQIQSITKNHFFVRNWSSVVWYLKSWPSKPPAFGEVFRQRFLEASQVCAVLKPIAYVFDSNIWRHRCWILETIIILRGGKKLSYTVIIMLWPQVLERSNHFILLCQHMFSQLWRWSFYII